MQRTPADFSFHVKTYGLLAGQPAEVSRMPRALVEGGAADARGREAAVCEGRPAGAAERRVGLLPRRARAAVRRREARRDPAAVPASFRATPENVEAMRRFVAAIERPEGMRLLWEPRGPWPQELIADTCRELGLLHADDPFIRPIATPELQYWRLHGNVSHRARYSDDDLLQIIDWLPADPAIEAYVLFNNIPRVHDVRRFVELLHERAGG